jgi:hypothetical protein
MFELPSLAVRRSEAFHLRPTRYSERVFTVLMYDVSKLVRVKPPRLMIAQLTPADGNRSVSIGS